MMTGSAAPGGGGARLPGARRSYALESFVQALQGQESLQILDLGGLNQSNLDFVTGLNHRLYALDVVQAADRGFSAAEWKSGAVDAQAICAFLDQTFEMYDRSAHGALVWDVFQFLPPGLQEPVLQRLRRVLVPGSPVLAFFHTVPGAAQSQYRIVNGNQVQLAVRAGSRTAPAMAPRVIERLFADFAALKFFLTRENLQEVIARR